MRLFSGIYRRYRKVTHKHEWTTICQMTVSGLYSKRQYRGFLQRCTCGREKAFYFANADTRVNLDPLWFRAEANGQGANIPDEMTYTE